MPQSDIIEEVRAFIRDGIEAKRVQSSKWITQAIVENHSDIFGSDADFYLRCALEHVRDTVGNVIGKFKDAIAIINPQIVLDGFEHLQKAYLIERDSDSAIVPIDDCTLEEINAKIAEYEQMAAGCMAHAKELRTYRKQKFGK